MAPQYFDNVADLSHEDIVYDCEVLGKKYVLHSDRGVFSNHELDLGSKILLETIGRLELGKEILDLGCGVGAIGLILLSIDPNRIATLSDVNERALALSKENARHMGLSERCTIVESDVYDHIDSLFDSIVSNPPIRAGKKVTYRIYDEAPSHLKDGGSLYLVVRRKQGAESVLSHLREFFPFVEVIEKKKGYWVIHARKGANQ